MRMAAMFKRSVAVALVGMGLAAAFLSAPKSASANVVRYLAYRDSDGPGMLTIMTAGPNGEIAVSLTQNGRHYSGSGIMQRIQANVQAQTSLDVVDFILTDAYGNGAEFQGKIYNFLNFNTVRGGGVYGLPSRGIVLDTWTLGPLNP